MAAEPSQSALAQSEKGLRLGGARADFVASLGRKVADLRQALARVTASNDVEARVELRRKLHALGSGAKLMKFDAMDRAIAESIASLDHVEESKALDTTTRELLEQVLDDLPALAWGDERARTAHSMRVQKIAAPTYSALIVGPALLAEALLEDVDRGPTFACECTPDAQAAFDLVCTTEPDLVIVDADVADATELVDALMDDARTEAIPLLVVGSFLESGEESRYVAMGVAKTIAKPTSREVLRETCVDALKPPSPVVSSVLSGDPTLVELSERLAEEIRSALVADVDARGRGQRIPLGEGTEVMSAVWGAIARVRELVSARTGGAVLFSGKGPEGAMTLASSFGEHDVARADRARAYARGVSTEVRLQGRRVVIADDDPAVVWFMADLLKTAGCVVHEAFDGRQAIELAYRTSPDLVVSDILMPELDGFAVCRTLRRDVALRDTPVILLSWKEDLLQRVRELGVSAAGYVRKESDAHAILARVREALRPRTRIEARLREEGRVRGRLDDLSVRTLLELVCAMKPDARISIRDASFLYEIEVRNGAPVRATCAAGDRHFSKGKDVLASVLGVRAGSFVVAPSTGLVDVDLEGNLAAQIREPVAHARAVATLLMTENAGSLRITRDEEKLDNYLRTTPETPRNLARRIANGTSVRDLILEGADATLVSELAWDLAARGIVRNVENELGVDLLGPAKAKLVEQGDKRASFTPPAAPEPSIVARREAAYEELTDDASDDVGSCNVDPAPLCESPLPSHAGSLEDALMREVEHRSPEPATVAAPSLPSMVDPAELKPRQSPIPPAVEAAATSDVELRARREREMEADWTPSHSEMLALAEPTVVDDTVYAERSTPLADAEIPGPEPMDTFPNAPSSEDAALDLSLPTRTGLSWKRESWPIVAFVAAVFAIAWAVMYFAGIEF